jgi:lysophospholipase L1-like esterase
LGARLLALLHFVISAAHCIAQAPPSETHDFALTAGDRVVLLGSAFIERDASQGYLETALTTRFYDQDVQFRNLGCSGDNVFGEARAGLSSAADGFEQLKKQVLAVGPTLVFLNYGANESFGGLAELDSFKSGLDALLVALDQSKARIIFITPSPHENLGPPLPDPTQHNKDLASYSLAIAAVAKKRGAPLVNLFELLGKKLDPPSVIPLTGNGMHLTAYGYWRAALATEQAIGLQARRWEIEIDARNQNISARGTAISQARFSTARIGFVALDEQLPLAPPPEGSPASPIQLGAERIVRVFGLAPGKYALRVDGEDVARGTAGQWTVGRSIATGPDFEQVEQLRRTIVAKNQLYFHRSRPQIETNSSGAARHEQQRNADEVRQFDPLLAAKEAEIRNNCAPVSRTYELVSVEAE